MDLLLDAFLNIMRFATAGLALLLVAVGGSRSHASLISTSSARLPMSLSSVINDLEAEDVQTVKTACLITSRGVTAKARKVLLQRVFGIDDPLLTAFGTDSGLIVALGGTNHPSEVASTVLACEGRIAFYPDPMDLSRGEGLFDTLGPAIEKLMAAGKKGTLVVVSDDPATCQKQLEDAATSVLANLVQPRGSPIKALQDVFAIQYISPSVDLEAVLGSMGGTTPEDAAASVSATVEFASTVFPHTATSPTLSHRDLAAARRLGPAARAALESALAKVVSMTSGVTFYAQFGALCDATVRQALAELPTMTTTGSAVANRIQQQLQEELYAELGDMFDQQLTVLQDAYFESFQAGLSNLRISPTLEADSEAVAATKLTDFTKAARDMIAKGSHWSMASHKNQLQRRMQEYVSARMTAAKASGKYKPIPRKGVTVGMHWLLPKPFGNDFRQEPWMVHATDNLVYVPKDKITNVNPEDVVAGDWRSKIVPSPNSREMVYMQ